jgi:hypothetical protein
LIREKRFSERISVEKPWSFEFMCKARVDAAGKTTWSPACESRGTKWKIQVTKDNRRDPNTVGIFLVQSSFTRKELAQRQKRLRGELSAKCQKTGKWTTKSRIDHIYASTADPDGTWGYNDYFGVSWDLVKDDRTLVDAAGDIELKLKATVELVESPEQESL